MFAFSVKSPNRALLRCKSNQTLIEINGQYIKAQQ